jgi:hypothetical protein
MLGDPAVLRVVERQLEVVEAGCHHDPSPETLVVGARERG